MAFTFAALALVALVTLLAVLVDLGVRFGVAALCALFDRPTPGADEGPAPPLAPRR